ncbi:MAG: DNA repair protein RecO [Candidatus Saccharibacteria bacterium]
MKQQATEAIVLARTSYGEADRILTVLTPYQGKIRLLAKGVRKIKSRLAGGIELFSVNDIAYIVGKGDLHTLVSARLQVNFGTIVKDIDRTMYAYDILKMFNRITEDSPEPEYFELLRILFAALNDGSIDINYIRLWNNMQLLKLGGHVPNMQTDTKGKPLTIDTNYTLSFDEMTFAEHSSGPFDARHIKVLRLALSLESPKKLVQIQGIESLILPLIQLSKTMLQEHARIT